MTGRFEKTAWLWTEINSVIMDSLGALPDDDVLEIRLERFSSETIRKVLSFVGRKPNADLIARMGEKAEDQPNQTDDWSIPAPDNWSDTMTNRFWDIAGETIKKLGYRNE